MAYLPEQYDYMPDEMESGIIARDSTSPIAPIPSNPTPTSTIYYDGQYISSLNGITNKNKTTGVLTTSTTSQVVVDDADCGDGSSSAEDDNEDEEFRQFTKPIFENPIALLNFDADISQFLESKRISDAVKIITTNFPKLPSKVRVPYMNFIGLTEADKEEAQKKRNRENAVLTRKRQRIYADFLDKSIEVLHARIADAKKK